MSETMKLLDKALEAKTSAEWARELNVFRTTLTTAKTRGHLSPSLAGAIAEKLGFDAMKWIVVAALENEKESDCTARMRRKFGRITTV